MRVYWLGLSKSVYGRGVSYLCIVKHLEARDRGTEERRVRGPQLAQLRPAAVTDGLSQRLVRVRVRVRVRVWVWVRVRVTVRVRTRAGVRVGFGVRVRVSGAPRGTRRRSAA